jgi:hypothetical protein
MPYRIGELVKLFPKLNITVVSVHDFPVSRAPCYNKKKECLPLPEWAAVKRKCDRFYFD